METIRNEKLSAGIDRAVDEGDAGPLLELLRRSSGLPGPRPNIELARAVGGALARREGRADALLRDLARSDDEYLRIVAAMTLVLRSLLATEKKKHGRAAEALADLQQVAEDPRHLVRTGIVEALRVRLLALGEPAVDELSAWTDGYLQAHVALEALADRMLLTRLSSAEPVLARLDEAFTLADRSPRAAERTQGMRALRQGMPAQIVLLAGRFHETIAWLEDKTASTRPETRRVVSDAIAALRRTVISDADAERLSAKLAASGKPPRDPSRVVQGTRKRGRGRR